MKQKKINLQGIKDVLSRDEMRKIMAGSDGGGCTAETNCCVEQLKCECSTAGSECSSVDDYTISCKCMKEDGSGFEDENKQSCNSLAQAMGGC